MAVIKKRINQEIAAPFVWIIQAEGGAPERLTLRDAITKAEELGVDVIEVGVKDGAPLARLQDYGKWLYEQKKIAKEHAANSKHIEPKCLRITYKMEAHDMGIRRRQAEEFAKEGIPLRVELPLRGRENRFEDIGREKIKQFSNSLKDIYKLEGDIKKLGKIFSAQFNPLKK